MMARQIRLGAMAPPIGTQMPDIDDKKAHHFELDTKAITRLFVRGLLTRAEMVKAKKRLIRAISAEIEHPQNAPNFDDGRHKMPF